MSITSNELLKAFTDSIQGHIQQLDKLDIRLKSLSTLHQLKMAKRVLQKNKTRLHLNPLYSSSEFEEILNSVKGRYDDTIQYVDSLIEEQLDKFAAVKTEPKRKFPDFLVNCDKDAVIAKFRKEIGGSSRGKETARLLMACDQRGYLDKETTGLLDRTIEFFALKCTRPAIALYFGESNKARHNKGAIEQAAESLP